MLGGRVGLVTGASSGIGAATARLLSKEGASLVLSGRDRDALARVAADCPGPTHLHPADLTRPDQVESLASGAVAAFGRLDCLVNNAGAIERNSLEASDEAQMARMLQLNLTSVAQLTRLAIPAIKQHKGSVVNVSSVNGMRAFPGLIAYNVSKAGLDQLTRCLALELAPDGVRVNSVNPGVIVTELHRRGYAWEDKEYEAFLEHSKTTHALGRVGRPEESERRRVEVAEAVAWLLSEKASFVTAASIPVDGGRHAMCPR